jgi:hypothetical protein
MLVSSNIATQVEVDANKLTEEQLIMEFLFPLSIAMKP